MLGLICHTCKKEFVDTDLIVPINIGIVIPSGRFQLTIYQHYICGLDYYLMNLNSIDGLTDKDRIMIAEKLLRTVENISHEGTIQ